MQQKKKKKKIAEHLAASVSCFNRNLLCRFPNRLQTDLSAAHSCGTTISQVVICFMLSVGALLISER